jgi:ABC-type lipopolysaccharide export system ATPase subunit
MELAVETIGLTKKYNSLIAVNKLNLKVEQNAIHGFLGPWGLHLPISSCSCLSLGTHSDERRYWNNAEN